MTLSSKKILVTGADGFIGSHLTEALAREGASVRALSQYNSFNSWGWLEELGCLADIEVITGDIRDPEYVKKATEGIDVIFHLAALIAIPYSYQAPQSYIETNITGTLNILQAARAHGVQRIMHTSTSEVYGTARYVPIDEAHPLQPQSPYSASKIGADAIAESFYRSFGLPVTIVRPFNTYGPRQSARAVIPTVIIQLLTGQETLYLGSLHPTRDFNYVEDTCKGFIGLSFCEAAIGQTINIGSNAEVSIGDTVTLIQEIMGTKARIETDDKRIRPAQSEVDRLWCDNSRINQLTGYASKIPLREGLERTISWLSQPANLRRYKAQLYNV